MIARRLTIPGLLLLLLLAWPALAQEPATPVPASPWGLEALQAPLPRSAKKLVDKESYAVLVVGEPASATWPAEFGRLLAANTGNEKIAVTIAPTGPRAAEDAAALFERDVLPAKPDLVLLRLGAVDAAQGRTLEAYLEAMQWMAQQITSRGAADVVFCQPGLAAGGGEVAAYAHRLARLAQRRGLPCAATLDRTDDAAMAAAVLAALQPSTPAPLTAAATLRWTAQGPRARITIRNVSDKQQDGTLALLPRRDERFDQMSSVPFALAPQATTDLDVGWLGCDSGSKLLIQPFSRLLAGGRATLTLVVNGAAGRQLLGVEAQFQPETWWVRNDGEVAAESRLRVAIEAAGRPQAREVNWPADSEVGRVRLLEPVLDRDGVVNWAATELYYLRFAGALGGETKIDGDLKEWSGARWSTLSDPAQRVAGPEVTGLRWAARIGKAGLSLAVTGAALDDRFTVALDPRPMALLGTVGRTFCVEGALGAAGRVALSPGESTPGEVKGLSATWRATPQGVAIEVYLPYAAMAEERWPDEEDIGLALLWRRGDTVLNWSGDSTWLSAREYGVLHRLRSAREKLPWVVRVR